MTNPSVPWVAGRRRALARAVAIRLAEAEGHPWAEIHQADRDRRVRAAEADVRRWVADGVLVPFAAEYREADQRGTG